MGWVLGGVVSNMPILLMGKPRPCNIKAYLSSQSETVWLEQEAVSSNSNSTLSAP